jgi:hypothetical protein
MEYKDYELLVKRYFEKTLQKNLKKKILIEHQKNHKTISGENYNIDLSYEFNIGEAKYLNIIECKCWRKPVERDHILALDNKKNMIGAHKAIAVSLCGFQRGAIKVALEKGIGLYKIETSGDVQVVSHFAGNYLYYVDKLLQNSPFENEGDYEFGYGIISPTVDPFSFIRQKYGVDVGEFFSVEEDHVKRLDHLGTLPDFPFDWNKEYEVIQTAGLDLVLKNEILIRIICFNQRMNGTEAMDS